MILRAKTKYLFDGFELTEKQSYNSSLNITECENGDTKLVSAPRRLVFELTNACNLNCIMCGRNNATFKPTVFKIEWLKKFEALYDKVEEVALFGWGEPTVHPQFVEILKYLDQYPVRKYFCTNGMRLDILKEDIFRYHVDLLAISLDGATAETNNRIRRKGDFNKICKNLREIVKEKREHNLSRPYMNFVFCAMDSNINELVDLVRLAADIGIEEVKVVYFTSFSEELLNEVLWNKQDKVKRIFNEAIEVAEKLNVKLKLPYIQGEDIAADKAHKDCYVGWRDLFLGSDGFVRPCMSTPMKFFSIDEYSNVFDMWNSREYIDFRNSVNVLSCMPEECKRCYQSSHCNWNKKEAYIQINEHFAPSWQEKK